MASHTRGADTSEKSLLSRHLHERGHSQVWMGLVSPTLKDTRLKGHQSTAPHRAAGITEPFHPARQMGGRCSQGFAQPICSEAIWLPPQALAEGHISADIISQGFWRVARVFLWLPPLSFAPGIPLTCTSSVYMCIQEELP